MTKEYQYKPQPPVKLYEETQKLEQDAIVELWELDLRKISGGGNDSIYYFCNLANELGNDVVWKGKAYSRYPIQGEGFEATNEGASPRPKLNVANVLGVVTALTHQFQQLIGAIVIRRQTSSRFLDAVNFRNGNAHADPTQEVVSKFVIEQMTSLTSQIATFELAIPAESDGSVVPARIMLAGQCCWEYRGEGCGYNGRAVADCDDNAIDDPKLDVCSLTLRGCQARFGKTAALPFGGFPSCDKVT